MILSILINTDERIGDFRFSTDVKNEPNGPFLIYIHLR